MDVGQLPGNFEGVQIMNCPCLKNRDTAKLHSAFTNRLSAQLISHIEKYGLCDEAAFAVIASVVTNFLDPNEVRAVIDVLEQHLKPEGLPN